MKVKDAPFVGSLLLPFESKITKNPPHLERV
jgi:hypothetical protein